MDAEVIVVGGGPAGSATAALLAQRGRDVLLLDRARFPRFKACAEYVSPASVDVLDRLGALPAVEQLQPVRPLGMTLIRNARTRALIHYPARITGRTGSPAAMSAPPDGGGEARRALCLSREVFDHALLQHAQRCGARVLEGWQVLSARAEANGAMIVARRAGTPPETKQSFRAQIVVGADGARSAVARSLGMSREVVWPRRVGFVTRFRADHAPHLVEYGEMHVGNGVYCGLAPLPGGLVNVGLVMDITRAQAAGGRESAFRAGLSVVPGAQATLEDAQRVTAIRGVSPLAARVSRPSGDGFVLVGDAAGFLDPFTGEGVYRALRGAELASETIDEALRTGDTSARTLARYDKRRRDEFAAKSALCWLIQGFMAAPPLFGYALRRIGSRPAVRDRLGAVLGDYGPAAETLKPMFLWELLRP